MAEEQTDGAALAFQRGIADRKFLAAFYTTPASSALLVGLAIRTATAGMRVADFACGTGSLLVEVCRRIGDVDATIVGCDVVPAAAERTAQSLKGWPGRHAIRTVAYGVRADGGVALGSLDLLRATSEHGSFDLVIMNPPYTRPTGHESGKVGVPNPMVAAFAATGEQQRAMGRAIQGLARGSCYHGNAGEASLFVELGHRMLRAGGTLALVLPLSALAGGSWEKTRELLARAYGELIVVSIAGPRYGEASFSSDTGSAECLIVGRKTGAAGRRAAFVVVRGRPTSTTIGAALAGAIRATIDAGLPRLEDGPVGGAVIRIEGAEVGQAIAGPLPAAGWPVARIAELSLAQCAYQAALGQIWLPGTGCAAAAAMTTIGDICAVGPYHADVGSERTGASRRGPLVVGPRVGSGVPVLWSHDARRETTMMFAADREGRPRGGAAADKLARILGTASHAHFNRDFMFNSQALGLQFTATPTIGGRAWISLGMASVALAKALVLWGNSTLGLLLHWWHANKNQTGRGSIGVEALGATAVLDVTRLAPERLAAAVRAFDALCGQRLLPVHQVDRDAVRARLDAAVIVEVLGLDAGLLVALGLLRGRLAAEPSIHRGKRR